MNLVNIDYLDDFTVCSGDAQFSKSRKEVTGIIIQTAGSLPYSVQPINHSYFLQPAACNYGRHYYYTIVYIVSG